MRRRYYLLTEGSDDANAMYHLLTKNRIPVSAHKTIEDVKVIIEQKGGVENLIRSLRVQLKTEDSESANDRIGVIIDADADSADEQDEVNNNIDPLAGLNRRWQAMRDLLQDVGYSDVPEVPNATGTIVGLNQDEKPQVGIWLMPDNRLPGKLENFAQLLIPANDTLWDRVEQNTQDIPENERKFKDRDLIKAQIHTWLAWQKDPGKPIGQAITLGFLSADALHAQTFISWIKTLYSFE